MASAIGNAGAPALPVTVQLPAARLQMRGTPPPATKTSVTLAESAGQQPSSDEVRKTVEALRKLIEIKSPNSLSFSIDEATGRTIVRITDAETGETIRQIPSEEILAIVRSLERMQGMLLQDTG